MEPMNKMTPYASAVNPAPAAAGTKETPGISKEDDKQKSIPARPAADEYIPEEKHASIGLYRIGKDEDGNPKVYFDTPSQSSASKTEPKKEAPSDPSGKASESGPQPKKSENKKDETCSGSTDKVDREIEKLKKEKQELEAQLRAEKDETKAEALQKRLAQVENELRRKDNDAYRRQHTVFS